MKTDVRPFELGLEQLLKVSPKYFKFNGLGGVQASRTPELGVIAQEVEKASPDLVVAKKVRLHSDDSQLTEIKQVKYGAFTYMLINAVKEQNAEIEQLKAENASIKAFLCGKEPSASICR